MGRVARSVIVVADICNTLYDSNTTFDFVKYCYDSNKIRKGRLRFLLVTSKTSPFFWALAVLSRLSGRDYNKIMVVSFLKGFTKQEVNNWANSFYDEFLQQRQLAKTNDLIRGIVNMELLLASSTIEPVAQVIAERLNARRFISTLLETSNGKLTGKILKEISGRKLECLTEILNGREIDVVLTDNQTDQFLMSAARKRNAICYSDRQVAYWRKMLADVNIIKINSEDIK